MKVAQVTNVDFSLRHFLLPLMRGARARGHEVVGICAEGPLLDLPRAEGFRILTPPLARSLDPRAQWRALRELRAVMAAERFDLVHAHMPISGLLARVAARSLGVPRVAYTSHGFLFNQPGPLWRRGLSLGMEWLGGRLSDTFLTVSEEEARDARRLLIHRNATATGNGRDPALFHPDAATRAALRAELGVGEADCVVLAVSRLVRHKGWPELLEAAAAVPGLHLWTIGERLASDHGEDMAPHFRRAEAAMGARLRRLGYRHDVARFLQAADIFCLPSHFEGLPMSVIEAMLSGLPIVTTDIKGCRELVRDGGTGLLVPPRDTARLEAALARLAADPVERRAMGEAGRLRALDRFTEARVVERTLDLLGL
ncbi:glycosyltransferase family 4 protein [Sabulicella glaciei]|uniref:Glycosyltransferase family 4 protein n=1 Tax=Sabulicella glaciei TaxID=2984948 RepID=A0ABT3P1W5_9PROT|nr:glycosyltransferase family 4 protein [Roseococcus sp. MDT2-1-1]MCW8088386.1 glycosyltransferase family 4 protein [Roseococcus sp. MDT2-1-1]